MNDENNKTIEAYELGLEQYNSAAIPNVSGSVKYWVDAGLKLLPRNGIILEIGSAHGRDADYMESKGFTVMRTDVAKSFVEYMKKNGKEARQLNALSDEFGGLYDMIYASAVLLHFKPEQVDTVLRKTYSALKPEGYFSFSVKIGEGSAWSGSKLNSPRFFNYWQAEPLKKMLRRHSFEIVFWEEGQTGHDNGDWYHVIAKKIA